jgi:hypothetical protein
VKGGRKNWDEDETKNTNDTPQEGRNNRRTLLMTGRKLGCRPTGPSTARDREECFRIALLDFADVAVEISSEIKRDRPLPGPAPSHALRYFLSYNRKQRWIQRNSAARSYWLGLPTFRDVNT